MLLKRVQDQTKKKKNHSCIPVIMEAYRSSFAGKWALQSICSCYAPEYDTTLCVRQI